MHRHLPKLLTLIFAAGVSGWLFAGDHGKNHGLPAVDDPAWRAECGSCHTAYPPAMLPERSWRRIMDGLDRHFGENASLDAAARDRITQFLVANAGDQAGRARKIADSVPAAQVPLRITETAWFVRKHDELRAAVWKHKDIGSRANCGACHRDADRGRFDERAIDVPGIGRWED